MKKVLIGVVTLIITIMIFIVPSVYATSEDNDALKTTVTYQQNKETDLATTNNNEEDLTEETKNKVLAFKNESEKEIAKYKEKYNSDTYGLTAYILNKVRFYSIPVCFIGIVIGALYQFVLGTRRLDKKHKGFNYFCYITCNMPNIAFNIRNNSFKLEGLKA